MTSNWHAAAVAALGLAALVSAAASLAMARRSRLEREALGRRVDELSLRLRTIESRERPFSGAMGGLPTSVRGQTAMADKPPVAPRKTIPPAPRFDRAEGPAVAGPTLIAVPSLASEGSDEATHDAAEALGRRYGPIWALADEGVAPEAIARATGQPIGQVDLILALRRPAIVQSATESAPAEAVGRV
jgi:hypothetical protein